MEDNLTNQEEQLRDLTENFSLDIDTSELWNNVEARLPSVQKKRRPLVWWFVTGVLVAVIGFLLWNINSNTQEENLKTNFPVASIEEVEPKFNTGKINKHTENTPLIESGEETKAMKTPISLSKVGESNLAQESINNDVIQEQNVSIISYDSYDEKPTSQEEVISQGQVAEESFVTALVDPSNSGEEKDIVDETNKDRETLIQVQANILIPSLIERTHKNKIDMFDMQIKPLKTSIWKPYFGFSSGINLTRSTIYSNTNESLKIDQFQSEIPLPGFSSTLRFGYENTSGWRFGIGLAHQRLVNRFQQKETISNTKQINGIESLKVDNEGNVISTEGIISETTITNYDFKWHRKHDFVNVQLSVGKRLIQKGRFTILTDASISKNIWSQHSGYYFTEDAVLISRFESGQDNPYTNSGNGLGLSLDLEYNFNEFSFSISPFASVGLNSIMQSSNYYQLKNSQYGIQLGVVYRP